MIRSRLWQPEDWPALDGLASLGEVIIEHSKLTASLEESDAPIERDARERLY